MTIQEAIQHCEEVAEEKEKLWGICPASENELFFCDGSKDCTTLANGKDKGCLKCAAEHRQLAEWLKDYKRLLEQDPCEDAISRQEVLDLCDSKDPEYKVVHFKEDVECLPIVNTQVKTGHWIDECPIAWKCSECHYIVNRPNNTLFCPSCGAKLIESEDNK